MKTFSIIESYKVGWDRLKVGWKFVLVSVVAMMLVGSISNGVDKIDNAATILITLPLSVLSVWLTVNMMKGVFRIYDKHIVNPEAAFKWSDSSVRETLRYIGLNIIIGITFLIFLLPLVLLGASIFFLGYAVDAYDIAAAVVITMIGVYINTRLMFSLYIMIDDNTTVLSSIKASWKMSRGYVLKLIGFYFVSALVAVLGFVLLLIPGVIFSGVLIFATTHIYRQLK